MWPRTVYKRRIHKDQSPFMRNMLELHYYRPIMAKWIGATIHNRHILHDADLDEDSLVLDVGAFIGNWSEQMAERYNSTIYAYEPNPKALRVLQKKAEDNDKFKVFPYGLGSSDVSMELTDNGAGSSMLENRGAKDEIPRIKVEIAAVERIWRELNLDKVDLMKVNIEGAEFPLFEAIIEAGLLPTVDC